MRVIWLLLVAAFVAILNETAMGIAIPHLNADLGLPPELGQWLTSAFMLTMAVVIPITGFLIQRLTTRTIFLVAMGLFSVGTLLALVAPGFGFLLVGRVVQAGGTAIMMPLLMTTMMNVVPPHSRGRMMGRVGIVMSLAPAIGPTLAGFILDVLNWRWIFGIVLPIALVALAIGAKWMLNLGETRRAPIDVLSIVLSALGFGGLVFGLSQFGGGEGGSSSPALGWLAVGIGVVALAAFVFRQLRLQRVDDALLDLRVFVSKNFTISVAIMAVIALALFGTLTLLPQYLQNVVGVDALGSGLVLLPGSVLMGVLGPVFGRIYDAKGPRILLVPGTIVVSLVLWFYATVTATTPLWAVLIAQTVMSVGMAMSFTPLFSASLGSLEPRYYSHGSAVLSTLQQVAGAAGVAILISAYSALLHSGQAAGETVEVAGAAGARTAFLIAAIVSLGAVVGSFFIRKPADQEVPAAH
ncbi:DHA2 family efflux MFS transporter permease subunit [Agromyces archimandritae]|uniref:DHA2 family efflux MFS transporter permease subunit n=2 Tax=Agromyces archimandritae TaxID=2781962 RepID=A0A975IQ49_9MICO|nr:DHA2 family efflux MFS transporter permease subunit [Agromyces archimandritae]QTX06323.1 DHA2 family efflux MFS transporter permease subunit [Agromyces archimandritae]